MAKAAATRSRSGRGVKYLITGGAGFIGSHLCPDRLLSRGDEVVLVDDLSTGATRNVEHLVASGVPLIEGSILDHPLMSRLMPGIDVVAHLAASVGVELVVREPLKSLLNNVRGTEIVLDAAMQTGAKVLVISTSEIYGKGAEGPCTRTRIASSGPCSRPAGRTPPRP